MKIRTVRHRGLKRFLEKDDPRELRSDLVGRIRNILAFLISASGKNKQIPLERHLADPVFGASLLEVNEDALYRVEYAKDKTRDYKITVFDYPALSRADASLKFPEYTGLTNKTIPDTLRISAVL